MKNISMQRKLKEFFSSFFFKLLDLNFVPKFTPPVLDFFFWENLRK